jgi:hexokinase
MALAAEALAVVRQFDYSDEEVNKGVKEFLRQMRAYPALP